MKMLLRFNANRPIAPSVSHTLHSTWTLVALFDVSSKMTNASRHNFIIFFSCALQRQKCVCRGHGLISPALFWARPHPNHVLSLVCILTGCVCVCVCVCACACVRVRVMYRDNLIHGDLHGGNVMVSPKSEIVTVIDAGLVTGVNLVRSPRPCTTRLSQILNGLCESHACLHTSSPLRHTHFHSICRGYFS
jgi:hypothetical protein